MDRGKRIIQTSLIGIVVNLVLVVFKAVVGAMTGSVAIIMDAINNLSDALSSVITIVGTKLAEKSRIKASIWLWTDRTC
ncbi:MAG: cation transporter [Lachnospiraceae bacterium]|nr:cation transporter [Lachnospiraceae bacterium]